MNFEMRHAIFPKNELLRKRSGRYTLADLINNSPIKSLKPSPLPCSCGNYPTIDFDSKALCLVSCTGCDIKFTFKGSYAGAVLEWNKLESVLFNINENKLIPFISFECELDDFLSRVDKVKKDALGLKKVSVRSEKKLINLIMYWCDFATYKAQQITEFDMIGNEPLLNEKSSLLNHVTHE